MKNIPAHRKRWATKQFSGNCGIGETMEKWGYQEDSDCPLCGQVETVAHVLQCQDGRAKVQWEKSITKLEQWLIKKDTLPELTDIIMLRITKWRNTSPYYEYTGAWPGLQHALSQQHIIGWQCFLEGLLSPQWEDCQDLYYKWLNKRNTGHLFL